MAHAQCPPPDEWPCYGHDPQATFASPSGNISGALDVLWRRAPATAPGVTMSRLDNSIAAGGLVVVHWAAELYRSFGGSTGALDFVGAADGITRSSQLFPKDSDESFAWPSYQAGRFTLMSDGYGSYSLSGYRLAAFPTGSADIWGVCIPDPYTSRLYCCNLEQWDDDGLFCEALTPNWQTLWRADNWRASTTQAGVYDRSGGLVVDNGSVFHSARYVVNGRADPQMLPLHSGVTATYADNGAFRWAVGTTPISRMSAGNGKLFLLEGPIVPLNAWTADANMLVARYQQDGQVAWSVELTASYPRVQAPVVAGDLVIVAADAAGGSASSIRAYDIASGTLRWAAAAEYPANVTYMAAALASGTLVVLGHNMIHVFALADGREVWQGALDDGLADPLVVGNRVYVNNGAQLIAMQARP